MQSSLGGSVAGAEGLCSDVRLSDIRTEDDRSSRCFDGAARQEEGYCDQKRKARLGGLLFMTAEHPAAGAGKHVTSFPH
jgi:hypothetical protein